MKRYSISLVTKDIKTNNHNEVNTSYQADCQKSQILTKTSAGKDMKILMEL